MYTHITPNQLIRTKQVMTGKILYLMLGGWVELGDIKAYHIEANPYKAIRGLATYRLSKLDLYL